MAIKQINKMETGKQYSSGLMNSGLRGTSQNKLSREEVVKKIERDRARDSEMVTGIFRFLENPRGTLLFTYKAYKGDSNEAYELKDEERYRLPRGVARHLNNNCYYKEYRHLDGPIGGQDIRMGSAADGRLKSGDMLASKKIHRTAFYPLDFNDEDLHNEMTAVDIAEVSIRV